MEAMRETIISAIADPNAAVILTAAGILGIYAEFCAPGRIFPGVLGGIFVLLGLSSIANLPINWMAVALLALAANLLVLEAKRTSRRWVAGIAGTLAMTLGLERLVDVPSPGPRIYWGTAVGVSLPLAAITIFLLKIAARARRNKFAP
jgi:membrane-bound serine protease (ClpP class)